MKRIALVSLAAAVLLAACGAQAAPTAVPPTAAPPTATPVPPTATPVPPTATPVPPTRAPSTPTPAGAGIIALRGVTETVKPLNSIETTIKLAFKGKDFSGKVADGELTMSARNNLLKKQSALAFGGPLATALMGDAAATLQATSIGVYELGGFSYTAITGAQDLCIKQKIDPAKPSNTMSPEAIVGTLGSEKTPVYGTLAGTENINGVPARKYIIDPVKTQASIVSTGKDEFYKNASITSGEIYVAVDGGYLLRMVMDLAGKYNDFKLEGTMKVSMDIGNINGNVEVVLPKSCDNPIGG
jgi:hypothetical protein